MKPTTQELYEAAAERIRGRAAQLFKEHPNASKEYLVELAALEEFMVNGDPGATEPVGLLTSPHKEESK